MTASAVTTKPKPLHRLGWMALMTGILLPALGVFSKLDAADSRRYASHPRPVSDYAEAMRRVEAKVASEDGFYEGSHSFVLSHGERTAKVIVLAHGFGSSPAPLRPLAEQFYDRGYNVLAMTMPYHGLADRMSTTQSKMKAEDFTRYGDEVVDIARGLGEHVTVAGISGGGLVTAWLAQERGDVDLAVLISPGLGFNAIRGIKAPLMACVITMLPNWYLWDDPRLKQNAPRPYNYLRVSSKAFGQILKLGGVVRRRAAHDAPAARSILVITNLHDPDVDYRAVDKLSARWRERRGSDVSTFAFPAELGLGHDIIDVTDPHMNVAAVYPRLMELIDR